MPWRWWVTQARGVVPAAGGDGVGQGGVLVQDAVEPLGVTHQRRDPHSELAVAQGGVGRPEPVPVAATSRPWNSRSASVNGSGDFRSFPLAARSSLRR